jgi:hypothetical protein
MKRLVWFLIMGGLVVSCAGLPEIRKTSSPQASYTSRACQGSYPRGNWQLLHTIQAELPGNQTGFLMGVTRLSSQKRSFQCVIMTLEGFVVFDALYDGTIRVERAVAPFNNQVFAQGVAADIQLIFFKPLANDTTTGTLSDGAVVCRHSLDDGSVIDVAKPEHHQWETRLYGPNHRLKRVITLINNENPNKESPLGIADKIELTAQGTPGYKLVLDLVEALALESEDATLPGSE